MKKTYLCTVYQYDEDGRNYLQDASILDISTFIAYLNTNVPDWCEIDVETEYDPSHVALYGGDDSRFIKKIVNPKSKYITVAQG